MGAWVQKVLSAGVMLCAAAVAAAGPRPAVVELFTSEGCSSCPPAEAYLGELAQRADVLALAFHVDYWDDLGWRDRFDLPQATERQRLYSVALRRPSVYTPQVLVDGQDDYTGTDRKAIGQALRASRSGVPVEVSVRGPDVTVRIGAGDPVAVSDVALVTYLRKAVSVIGRGENAGRTLEEFNIVRTIRKLGRWEGQPRTFQIAASSLPADATNVAVLVQPVGQGPIIGAASAVLR